MVPTQTLLGKHNASYAQQDIFVPLLLKGSSLVRMEHIVRMAQLSVQSVQVDTGKLCQIIEISAMSALFWWIKFYVLNK